MSLYRCLRMVSANKGICMISDGGGERIAALIFMGGVFYDST